MYLLVSRAKIAFESKMPVEPTRSRPTHCNSWTVGFRKIQCLYSLVAQLAEQRTVNPCVGGSSPPGGASQIVAQTREPWKFPGLFAFLDFIGF